jgi:hypothetical protein
MWWRGLRSLGYIVGSGGGQGRVGGAHAVPIQEETGAGNGRVSSRSKQRGEKEEGAGGGGAAAWRKWGCSSTDGIF